MVGSYWTPQKKTFYFASLIIGHVIYGNPHRTAYRGLAYKIKSFLHQGIRCNKIAINHNAMGFDIFLFSESQWNTSQYSWQNSEKNSKIIVFRTNKQTNTPQPNKQTNKQTPQQPNTPTNIQTSKQTNKQAIFKFQVSTVDIELLWIPKICDKKKRFFLFSLKYDHKLIKLSRLYAHVYFFKWEFILLSKINAVLSLTWHVGLYSKQLDKFLTCGY